MSENFNLMQTSFFFVSLFTMYNSVALVQKFKSKLVYLGLRKSTQDQTQKKQGAYGKVAIHQQSLIHSLLRPDEVVALLSFKKLRSKIKETNLVQNQELYKESLKEDFEFCERMLNKVSRSFALVIKLLPENLRLTVCVFYLVLRVLDTIEDDMSLDLKLKVSLLQSFHERLTSSSRQTPLRAIGEADELYLLENFDRVINAFDVLPKVHQDVIIETTRDMAEGMQQFISRDLRNGTKDEKDFFEYCHYVAGTVGEGCTKFFQESKTLDPRLQEKDLNRLAESMSQVLQRTNIIRDYLEDLVDGRAFWPMTCYNKYLEKHEQGQLGALINSPGRLDCLNEMIGDTLKFVPDMIGYLNAINDVQVLQFCAIPQIMAVRTLEEVFANKKLFTGVVKISKGQSAKIMMALISNDLEEMRSKYKSMIFESLKVIKKTALNLKESEVALEVIKRCDIAIALVK